MAKYKLLADAVIDDVLRKPGYEIEYDGVPGSHMEPLDAAAKHAVEERDKDPNRGHAVGSPIGAYIHVEPPPLGAPPPKQNPKRLKKPQSTEGRRNDMAQGEVAVAKYKLLAQHFSEEDKLLEPDTIVGDGSQHKWTRPPTVEMEGLDDEGKKAVTKERERVGETVSPIDALPMTGR